MKKVSLDTWIQLLGMIGLLGGLIFVGFEMRQSQIIALGAQQHARTEMAGALWLAGLEGETDIHAAMSKPWPELSANQKSVREQIQRHYWMLLQNNHYQYELGLINEELWAQIEGRIRTRYSESHLRNMIIVDPSDGLRRLLNSLPDNCTE